MKAIHISGLSELGFGDGFSQIMGLGACDSPILHQQWSQQAAMGAGEPGSICYLRATSPPVWQHAEVPKITLKRYKEGNREP